MNSVVIGVGASLPKKCVTNFDLSEYLDTSDEWISTRTGIKQRYIAENETTASLATQAAAQAIEHAGITASDVDLIIVGTVTGDYTFPSTATLVQRNLDIKKGVAFDLSAACSGFVYALSVADSFIKSGKAKCALVIGAETFSRIVDWKDRSSCVLFGDGAGAIVLKGMEGTDRGVQYCKICSDGRYADCLITSGGVSSNKSTGVVQMKGGEVFRFAVEKFSESLNELLHDNGMTIQDVDLIVPHQANLRIIKKLAEVSGIDEKKVIVTINKHANTSAASIPLALNEFKDAVFSKKNVVLLSMGAGFTWGSALIRFS